MRGKKEVLETLTQSSNCVVETRQQNSSADHERFFTEMLGDIDEPTLPFGLGDVDQIGSDFKEAHLKLSQALTDQLRAHARNLQVSLASICHLAWAEVVAKASGRETVVFGTVLLGHGQGGEDNNTIMGPMNNTLPMRLNIDDRSVETSVRDTHVQLSNLLAHEHTSLSLAQRCSGVLLGLPLFSSLLHYRQKLKTEEDNTTRPGVSFWDHERQTDYPLTLLVDDNESSWCLSAIVVSSVSATRICAYMQQSLESLVDALTHSPQQSIQKLRVVPSDERYLLLHGWNQTTLTESPSCCLHQLFEAQVECDGQATAVEYQGQTLSYSELNAQANRLAHHLIAQGVKPDDRIALCVERSTAMIAAILGILKAGCAYVPLDPAFPSQRLTNILLDTDPIFLVADETGRSVLGDHQIRVINLQESLSSDLPIDNPDTTQIGLTPAHLAYIIYTSGSTGTPKGVMVEHGQVVRHMKGTNNQFGFNKQDKWCFFHSISYDMSLSVIWGALLYGGQLFILPNHIAHSADDFYDWICAKGITVIIQTPSLSKILMRAKNFNLRVDHLRYVMFGGEAIDPIILKDWYEKCDNGKTSVVSRYGSTETVMLVRVCFCDRTFAGRSTIPLGGPLPNKSVYLLDSQLEPVPLGAEGEIYVGGVGMARGYFNRPELTAERFLPDPFSAMPAARMYRTGDRARYLPDGNLIFLGRTDQQVKIRGFRIELGEIEARLIEHPQVSEAVVQPYGKGSDAFLVAYVVADKDEYLVQNLRTYLMALLPDFMVPSAYVRLSSLPLTANGKLHRRALPAPDDQAFARQQYEAPRGEMEEHLAQIWRELLSIDRISRHDNFFALGGHSLLIVRLLAQLRQLGLDATVKELFSAPSLAILASTLTRYKAVTIPHNLITEHSTEITPEMLPLINLSQADIDSIIAQIPGGVSNIQDIYGLTPLQNGMLYHHLMAKEGDPYLIVSRLRFNERSSLERYADAMQQVIERHDILRTAILSDGLTEPAQVVLRQVPSLLSQITLNECGKPALEQLSQQFNVHRYHLDLKQPPLLRLFAAQESEGSWVAVEMMHHLIIDHSTLERLQAEIHAIMCGKKEVLETQTPFRNFVVETRQQNSSADTRFFTEMLGDIDEPTLPFALSEVHQIGSDFNDAHLKLSKELTDQLRTHARNLQVSLASICHLAYAQVVAKASGREAVVFCTVLLGRLQGGEGISTIMGPLINTLPIRVNIDDKSIETSVRDTHARLSALLDHEHASLILAQRCSGIPVGLPLFSALLNYRQIHKTDEVNTTLPGVNFLDHVRQTNYPLSVLVDDHCDDTLCLSVRVVSPLSAARICGNLQQSLESLVDALSYSPQKAVRMLTVMPPEEYDLLLNSWNQTQIDSHVCYLHHLFEAHVESDGNAIAVKFGDQTRTYAELNVQANKLAHYLISNGVQPDDRIALCAERSIPMITAILGVLKSGCAYVPLDPSYSSQRLTTILLDAEPIFVLADATGREVLGCHEVPVIELEKPLPTNLPTDNPSVTELGLLPTHLAYVIYTSGSTGKPKGVMVEHQHVVRHFKPTRTDFELSKHDNWSLCHSISFDVSIWEMWGALAYGSQLSIAPYNIVRSMDDYYDWICTSGITVFDTTPSVFKMIVRSTNSSTQRNSLRYILSGGEELDPIIAKEWLAIHSTSAIFNMYGPTETTIYSTYSRFDTSDNYIVTIGRPLADLRVYLLNSNGELALFGAEGEIHIGGAGVTRGYLKRPDLTAERFLPDTFSKLPGARMYASGDLARYLPDGNILFLGRIDQQVKIRGFRIELGEIESQLIGHPQVKESVVVARKDNRGNKRLIAYIVSAPNAPSLEPLEIRQYLQSRLPDYMIPAAYVSMNKLPTSQNGKLDRMALPEPDESAFLHQPYEEPISELERAIASAWQTLLKVDKVGRHDHFFELGGHSLLAIGAVNLINRAINSDKLRVSDIFAAPTVMNLAQRINSQNRSSEQVDLQKTAFLPEDIQPLSVNERSGKAILLTGATGFVGRFLLRELLDTTQSKIYCLVRGQNEADSRQRLMDIMSKWRLWRESDEQRLVVLHSDIKKERLGLNEQIYDELSKDVGIIFHLAVSMNHLETFDMAYQANVLGLIELLRLATRGSNKIMNFASTISIFRSRHRPAHQIVDEASDIKDEKLFADEGYAASKWVGEEIVNLAIARGIACNIFRLGLITADSELARYDELQAFYRLLKSSVQMGMAFDDFNGDIQMTPVDFTAKGLAHLGHMHNSSENIFHFCTMNKIPRPDFIKQLNVHLQQPMAVVSHREWLQEVRRRFHQGEILPITPLIQDLIMSSDEELDIFYKSEKEATLNFDSSKTLEKLAQAGITIPVPDHQWYRIFVDSLTK